MNDEIKEILECLKKEDNYWSKQEHNYVFPDYYSLNREDLHLLLDYITNLQQDTEMYAQLKEEYEEEIKEANDSITWWTNRFKAVQQENKRLKEQINQYENPDDMTLFYMWLDAKAKDKMKDLQQENEDNLKCIKSLKEQLESVIKNNQELLEKWHKNNDKIVNLISENERLKDILIEKDSQIKEMIIQKNDYTAVNILEMKLEDYKTRCEKAIEYCKSYSCWQDEDGTFHETDFCIDDLLNILQNGSDSQ